MSQESRQDPQLAQEGDTVANAWTHPRLAATGVDQQELRRAVRGAPVRPPRTLSQSVIICPLGQGSRAAASFLQRCVPAGHGAEKECPDLSV